MSFSKYLRSKLSEGGVNSKSIIARLQLFSNVFEKLDSVTLSRWVNNHTVPSLEKQLLVFQCFETKLYPYLQYASLPSISRTSTKVYESVFDSLESSYHSILTCHSASTATGTATEKVSWPELRNIVPGFYESTSSYQHLINETENKWKNDITLCSFRSGNKVISHLSMSKNIHQLKYIFKGNLDIDFNKESLFFNIGYYACRNHYNVLIGIFLNYICDKHERVKDFYVIVRGVKFLELIEDFGGRLLSANKESKVVGNVYLIRLNITEILSNPFIFSLLKESYEIYQEEIDISHNGVSNM